MASWPRGDQASYLCRVLDSIHRVLGAVVIRGAPVQVELAEPVRSTERAAPQHCDAEKPGQQRTPFLRPLEHMRWCPGSGGKPAGTRWRLLTKHVLAALQVNGVSLLSYLCACLSIFTMPI